MRRCQKKLRGTQKGKWNWKRGKGAVKVEELKGDDKFGRWLNEIAEKTRKGKREEEEEGFCLFLRLRGGRGNYSVLINKYDDIWHVLCLIWYKVFIELGLFWVVTCESLALSLSCFLPLPFSPSWLGTSLCCLIDWERWEQEGTTRKRNNGVILIIFYYIIY